MIIAALAIASGRGIEAGDHDAPTCDGKNSLNVLPLPTSLETSIRPPCASTIRRAM